MLCVIEFDWIVSVMLLLMILMIFSVVLLIDRFRGWVIFFLIVLWVRFVFSCRLLLSVMLGLRCFSIICVLVMVGLLLLWLQQVGFGLDLVECGLMLKLLVLLMKVIELSLVLMVIRLIIGVSIGQFEIQVLCWFMIFSCLLGMVEMLVEVLLMLMVMMLGVLVIWFLDVLLMMLLVGLDIRMWIGCCVQDLMVEILLFDCMMCSFEVMFVLCSCVFRLCR